MALLSGLRPCKLQCHKSHQRQRDRRPGLRPLAKMHVPSDSFGGRSPERKAADALRNFFTFAAVKIILAQLEGSGRGGLASYNAQAYQDLMQFLERTPLRDGDEWVAALLEHNEMLGVRVLEVRAAYAAEDFEWDECKKLALREMGSANVRLLRQFAQQRFSASLSSSSGGSGGGEGANAEDPGGS